MFKEVEMSMFNEDALALREEIDITRRTLVQNLDDFKISREALEKEIASLKEQLEESSSLVKDSFEIICMTCTKRSNIDNRIKVQAWLKKARVTQARREK